MLVGNNPVGPVAGRVVWEDELSAVANLTVPPRVTGGLGYLTDYDIKDGHELFMTDGAGMGYRAPGATIWQRSITKRDTGMLWFSKASLFAFGSGGVAYTFCSMGGNTGRIFRSTAYGAPGTWAPRGAISYSTTEPNTREGFNARHVNKKFAVDPYNNDHIVFSVAGLDRVGLTGLMRSTDGGATAATRITAIPLPDPATQHRDPTTGAWTNVDRAIATNGGDVMCFQFNKTVAVGANSRCPEGIAYVIGKGFFRVTGLDTGTIVATNLAWPGECLWNWEIDDTGAIVVVDAGTDSTASYAKGSRIYRWTLAGGWTTYAMENAGWESIASERGGTRFVMYKGAHISIRNASFAPIKTWSNNEVDVAGGTKRSYLGWATVRDGGTVISQPHWPSAALGITFTMGLGLFRMDEAVWQPSPGVYSAKTPLAFDDFGWHMLVPALSKGYATASGENYFVIASQDKPLMRLPQRAGGQRAPLVRDLGPQTGLAHAMTSGEQAIDDPNYIVSHVNCAATFNNGPDAAYFSANQGRRPWNQFPNPWKQIGFHVGAVICGNKNGFHAAFLGGNCWAEETNDAWATPSRYVELYVDGVKQPMMPRSFVAFDWETDPVITQSHAGGGLVNVTIPTFIRQGITFNGATISVPESGKYLISFDDPTRSGGSVTYQTYDINNPSTLRAAYESNDNPGRIVLAAVRTVDPGNLNGQIITNMGSFPGSGFGFTGAWYIPRICAVADKTLNGRAWCYNDGATLLGVTVVPRGLYQRDPATGRWNRINAMAIPGFSSAFFMSMEHDPIGNCLYICFGNDGSDSTLNPKPMYRYDIGINTLVEFDPGPTSDAPSEPFSIGLGAPYRPGYPKTIWATGWDRLGRNIRSINYSIDKGETWHHLMPPESTSEPWWVAPSQKEFGHLIVAHGSGGVLEGRWLHIA